MLSNINFIYFTAQVGLITDWLHIEMKLQVELIIVMFVCSASGDKSITKGGIKTEVKGNSGKIAIFKSNGSASDGVTINFDAIREVDTNGDAISDHSFNNFAQLEFTVSDIADGMVNGVNASTFQFKADIDIGSNTSTLITDIYVFPVATTISIDGYDVALKPGMLKFNIEVTAWPFCNPCTKGNTEYTGSFLELDIEVKGKKAPKSTTGGNKYDLGGGATFGLSTGVSIFFYARSREKDKLL